MSGVTITCQQCGEQVYSGPGDDGPMAPMLAHYRETHGPVAAVVRCDWCSGRGRRVYVDEAEPRRRYEEPCGYCGATGRARELGVAG